MIRRASILFLFALACAFTLTDRRPPWDAVKLVSFDRSDASDRSFLAQSPTNVGNISFASRVASFDGSGDAFRFGDSDPLSFTDGAGTDRPFTFSVWVKFTTTGTCDLAIKGIAGSYEYQFGLGSGAKGYVALYNPTATVYIDHRSNTALTTATWYHLAATYSGSEANTGFTWYLNGATDNGTRGGGGSYTGMTNGSGILSCGSNNSGTSSLNGSMDDFRFFSRQLSANEIAAMYSEGVGVPRP